MYDLDQLSRDSKVLGYVITLEKDGEILGYLAKNGFPVEDVINAEQYPSRRNALDNSPKILSAALMSIAEANGTGILSDLGDLQIKDALSVFQIRELKVV